MAQQLADNMPPTVRAQVAAEEAVEARGFRLLGAWPLESGGFGAFAQKGAHRLEALGPSAAAALWHLERFAAEAAGGRRPRPLAPEPSAPEPSELRQPATPEHRAKVLELVAAGLERDGLFEQAESVRRMTSNPQEVPFP